MAARKTFKSRTRGADFDAAAAMSCATSVSLRRQARRRHSKMEHMALSKINAEALAPFATLLKPRDGKPSEMPAVLEIGDVPGRHAFTLLCPQPAPAGSISIRVLERHPHSVQTFVPLVLSRWVVCVAPTLPDGAPDMAGLRAFVAGPEDAICIGRNVWHAPLTVLDRPAEVGMIMWKADAGDDGIVVELPEPLVFSL